LARVAPEDICEKERGALRFTSRLCPAYRTRNGERLWVIREWDRRVVTLLKPAEY